MNGSMTQEELQNLTDKRKDLDKLMNDMHQLESGRTPVKSPTSRTRATNPFQDDLYGRVITLEKEIKLKDEQMELLMHEKKSLEKMTKKQEDTVSKLNKELNDTKQIVLQLQYDLRLKTD